jgi:NAD+ kinase
MSTHPPRFQRVALIGRSEDARVAETVRNVAGHLTTHGCKVLVPGSMAIDLAVPVERVDDRTLMQRAQLIVAVGGDGTMLHAARYAAPANVPLLGVNHGRLGFLADIGPQEALGRLDEVLAGRYIEDRRGMIHAVIEDESGTISCNALNDVTLQRWQTGRMLDFETVIDGHYVNSHFGDGLIIATATGSTAYALSCGGPIMHPSLEAWVLAPICPHTLSDRPVVIRDNSVVDIRLLARPDTQAQVTCDGVAIGALTEKSRLRVTRADLHLTLLHPEDHSYFRVLRSKLRWGRGDRARDGALER